jgi:predicted peptidase
MRRQLFRAASITAVFVAACVAALADSDWKTSMKKRKYTDAKGKSIPYRLLEPPRLEKGKLYPLVIFLHGAGERGDDNEAQLVHGVAEFARAERVEKYPCFLAAPQCPKDQRWADVDWTKESHEMKPEPTEPGRLTLELVEALKKDYPIDPNRVYITGLSMGGFGTLDLLCRQPETFAAGVIVCGGGDERQAEKLAATPLWFFHGLKDNAVKPIRSKNMVEALKKAGGNPKLTEYPDVAHNSWVPAYKDDEMFAWLFAQKRGN